LLNRLNPKRSLIGAVGGVAIVSAVVLALVLTAGQGPGSPSVAHGSVAPEEFPEITTLHRAATASDVLPAALAAAVPDVVPSKSRRAGTFVDGGEELYLAPGRRDGEACLIERSVADGTVGTVCGPVGNGKSDAQPVIFMSRPAVDGGKLLIMGIVPDRFSTVVSAAGRETIRANAFAVRIGAKENSFTLTGSGRPHVVDVSAFHTPVTQSLPPELPPDQRRSLQQAP
jgi:hypothetical protein